MKGDPEDKTNRAREQEFVREPRTTRQRASELTCTNIVKVVRRGHVYLISDIRYETLARAVRAL